ncbi:MAG: hypothetical protein ABW352_08140 [Polyangiales bacterium]
MSKMVAASVVLLALGCAGAQHGSHARGSANAGTANKRSAACESDQPVEIAYRDAPGGSSVSFATTGSVDALRERVNELAEYHNGSEDPLAMHDLNAIPHRAQVEPLERGAKLTLIASASNDTDALRKSVQQDVEQLKAHGCIAGQEAL